MAGGECVACGKVMKDNNHHCDPKWEHRIEKIRMHNFNNLNQHRQPNFMERLATGFFMLQEDF